MLDESLEHRADDVSLGVDGAVPPDEHLVGVADDADAEADVARARHPEHQPPDRVAEEVEPLLSLAQTFRTFMRRQKQLPDSRKQAHINFARFTRALFMIKLGQKHNLPQVAGQIEAAPALIEKGWLLEKVAELGD